MTSTGYQLRQPHIPLVPGYAVLGFDEDDERAAEPTTDDIAALWAAAHHEARRLSLERFGDPGCYSLLFNGARRRPWPHVHIVLADSVEAKRRAFFFLSLKHATRPSRWSVLCVLAEFTPMPAPMSASTLALTSEDLS